MPTVYGYDPVDTLEITSLGTIPEATHLVKATSGAVYAWERTTTTFIVYRCTISGGVLTKTEVDRVTDAPNVDNGGTDSALALGTAIYFFMSGGYYKFEAGAITSMAVGSVEDPTLLDGYLGTDGTHLFWMSADVGSDTEIRVYDTSTGLWNSVGLTGQPLEEATSEGVAYGGNCCWPVIYAPGAPNDEACIVKYTHNATTATRYTVATGILANTISRLASFNGYLFLIHMNASSEVTLSRFNGTASAVQCTFGFPAATFPDYTIYTTSPMFVADNGFGESLWIVGQYFGELAVYKSNFLDSTYYDVISNLTATPFSTSIAVVL